MAALLYYSMPCNQKHMFYAILRGTSESFPSACLIRPYALSYVYATVQPGTLRRVVIQTSLSLVYVALADAPNLLRL